MVLGVLLILLDLLIHIALFCSYNYGTYARILKERGEYKIFCIDNLGILLSFLFILASILLKLGIITIC